MQVSLTSPSEAYSLSVDCFLSLHHLPQLRHLELHLHDIFPGQLEPLARLATLEHCSRKLTAAQFSLATRDLLALATLTQLITVQLDGFTLQPVRHTGHNSCLLPNVLRGLVNLQTLSLGVLAVEDAVFSALCALTNLTSLSVGTIQVQHAAQEGMSKLQVLGVGWSPRPAQLLHTLLPLAPLPFLRTVWSAVSQRRDMKVLMLDVG